MMRSFRWLLWFCSLMLLSASAFAGVRFDGDWPEDDKNVSLSVTELPRADALRKLADQAGWSIVIDKPNRDKVDVQVKNQPPRKVMELLLTDRDYLVKREGTLVHVSVAQGSVVASEGSSAPSTAPLPASSGAAPAVPLPASAATAPAVPLAATSNDEPTPATSKTEPAAESSGGSGEDRVITGGKAVVRADEVVADLVVMGGAAEIYGVVTGDVSVLGGSAKLFKGAHVHGDASVMGGSLDVEDGARIDGSVDVLGGKVRRGDEAHVGGRVRDAARSAAAKGNSVLRDIGQALTRTAVLFVFGAVLLALATRRMESLEKEIAARPMRTFALGIVGLLLSALVVIVLCVTLVGIPLAVIGVLVGTFATYVGIAAALTTLGGALIHHKTPNPYAHLALGCVLYLAASSLPFIGGFVTAALVLVGIGSIFATRGAGFVRRKNDNGPYRTAAA